MAFPNDKTDYSTIYPDGETDTKIAESDPDLADRLDRLEVGAGRLEDYTGLVGSSDPTSLAYKTAAAVTAASAAGTNLATHLADPTDAHDASSISLADPFNLYASTDVEFALTEVMGQIFTLREYGYHVKNGIDNIGTNPVQPTNTGAQNRDRLQAIVDRFQDIGQDVPLLFEPNSTYLIDRNASTSIGLTVGNESAIWLDSLSGRSTILIFTSTTANDTFIKWAGDDAADFSGRCHAGGSHGIGILSQTGSAPTRGLWMVGCDRMDLEFNCYGFGYEALLANHWTDHGLGFFAADHCGMLAGKYAVTVTPGFFWATDSLTWEHLSLEQCQRDLKISGGVQNNWNIKMLKTEHAEPVNHLEPLVLIDGSNIEAVHIQDWQIYVTSASGGTIPALARFNAMSGLALDRVFISVGNSAIASRFIECEDVFGLTPQSIRATLGGTTARPPKGILHLKGNIRMPPIFDVDYNWNGSARGSGTSVDYGDAAPFAVTQDAGANVEYMAIPTANVPVIA